MRASPRVSRGLRSGVERLREQDRALALSTFEWHEQARRGHEAFQAMVAQRFGAQPAPGSQVSTTA